jgi:hypothetical protein
MALPLLSELSSVLSDLPFFDKSRLVEFVICPESDGKVFVRYLRSNGFFDTGGTNQPITDQDPIADLRFDLGIDKVENIISGLSKQSLSLSNFKR